MGLSLKVGFPASARTQSAFRVQGDDEVTAALLPHVRLDLELPADEDGNPFLQLSAPDRRIVVCRSKKLSGDLFFALEEIFAGTNEIPQVVFECSGVEGHEKAVIEWSLVDFSGAWVQANRAAESGDGERAVAEARRAVEANPGRPGYRVVLGRYLKTFRRFAEARSAFEEELSEFPSAYRAMGELALLDIQDGKAAEGLKRLQKAISVYPNYLRGLLLAGELFLASSRDERALLNLARAWRLVGSTAPQVVTSILERRDKQDLLPKIRSSARKVELSRSGTRSEEKSASDGTVQVSPQSLATVSEGDAVVTRGGQEPKPVELPVNEATREDVIRLAAHEVFKDGVVSAEEKVIFRNVCARFPLSADKIKRIVAEEKERIKTEGTSEGELDPRHLFRLVLERVYEDGAVSRAEAGIVLDLARTLGLSRDECATIQREFVSS